MAWTRVLILAQEPLQQGMFQLISLDLFAALLFRFASLPWIPDFLAVTFCTLLKPQQFLSLNLSPKPKHAPF